MLVPIDRVRLNVVLNQYLSFVMRRRPGHHRILFPASRCLQDEVAPGSPHERSDVQSQYNEREVAPDIASLIRATLAGKRSTRHSRIDRPFAGSNLRGDLREPDDVVSAFHRCAGRCIIALIPAKTGIISGHGIGLFQPVMLITVYSVMVA
jgi:hypothetical protein